MPIAAVRRGVLLLAEEEMSERYRVRIWDWDWDYEHGRTVETFTDRRAAVAYARRQARMTHIESVSVFDRARKKIIFHQENHHF
jgi:hypothetical protein